MKESSAGLKERVGRLSESWMTISEPHDREDYTKRWDWHAWQLFVALLPAAGRVSSLYFSVLPFAQHRDKMYSYCQTSHKQATFVISFMWIAA